MLRKIGVIIILAAFVAASSIAEEAGQKKSYAFSDWIKAVQQKIEKLVPKKNVPLSTGVAGVRGAKGDSQTKLYWKGKKGEEPVTEEELAEFKEGIDRAAKGDTPGAIHEFQEFMKLYPDSALVPDVKKALDLATAEGQGEKK